MRAQRSMVFYAWLGLVVEFVLVLGVVAFVLAGAGYQRSAILLLSQRVQRTQLVNLTLQSEFLNTQRALRGYQATGQGRFAQTFFAGQADFVLELVVLRQLAWPGVLDGVIAQEGRTSRPLLRGHPVQDPRPGQSPQHHQLKGEIRLPSVKGLRKPVLSGCLVPAERALGIEEFALQRQVDQLHALNALTEEQNG